MNDDRDIVLRSDVQAAFPGLADQLKRATEMLHGCESFADLERLFLKGEGLSPATYQSYTTAVKQLYEHSGGLSPIQIIPADIESFYDDLVKDGASPKTCAARITGLRKFFGNLAEQVPFYTSPFDGMTDGLKKKLSRTGKSAKKKALTMAEMRGLLSMLRTDNTWDGRREYGIVLFLYTTGLRAAEFVGLTWADVADIDGTWIATFTQKGGATAEQEIPAATMDVAREAFVERYGRSPQPADPLFGSYRHTRMSKQALWATLKRIEVRALAAGVLTRQEIEFSAHLFRRTAGTHLMRRKMDVVSIQRFMRHRSFSTTARHYLDVGESAAPVFADILGQRDTSPVMSRSVGLAAAS